jgi:transposase
VLSLSVHQRYYLFRGHADMRKGFDSLCGMVRDHLHKDPLGGDVFVFINRRRNQIKLLCWEGDGFMLFYKRLEKGTFELPKGEESRMSVEILSCLLQGIKLSTVRKRKRYDSTKLISPIHAA